MSLKLDDLTQGKVYKTSSGFFALCVENNEGDGNSFIYFTNVGVEEIENLSDVKPAIVDVIYSEEFEEIADLRPLLWKIEKALNEGEI